MSALQMHQPMPAATMPAATTPDATRTRGERTAAKLRAAAVAAFAELGWSGTRVEDVVQRAQVSHGTFYTYYDNKSVVLAGLVARTRADFTALAESPWDGQDVHEALRTVITGFLDLYERDAVIMRTWIEAAQEDEGFTTSLAEMRARFSQRVGAHVASAVASSGHPVPPETIALGLVAMVEQTAYRVVVLGEAHERSDVSEALVLIWGSTMNALAGQQIFDEARAA